MAVEQIAYAVYLGHRDGGGNDLYQKSKRDLKAKNVKTQVLVRCVLNIYAGRVGIAHALHLPMTILPVRVWLPNLRRLRR